MAHGEIQCRVGNASGSGVCAVGEKTGFVCIGDLEPSPAGLGYVLCCSLAGAGNAGSVD